jgi:DNA repair protein RecN (Recombination protein N)
MTQVEFKVSITLKPDAAGIIFPQGNSYSFNDDGADEVVFIVSTNPGEPAQPLNKIASTGELSRFTLALKSALAGTDSIPVLIFDEIDIGIGGRSGDIIGKKLWLLGRTHQVICVTHLPQIAAFADAHFGVRKVASGDRTLSVLETFVGDSGIRELAAMLSGSQFTETAIKNAEELKLSADGWKNKEIIEPKRLI